jgi:hypothetical protein
LAPVGTYIREDAPHHRPVDPALRDCFVSPEAHDRAVIHHRAATVSVFRRASVACDRNPIWSD